ncbi:NAD(P)H-hydrate epimerase [Agromyces sp. LHK192]|uniref:NAD(P)H-hydrate epimerase n=1 Tax=Agromyces sp. LHK192 TaxID=2498704 RepID=UPI000FDB9C68|nr:NAD(P)H-hydrate epimerase [Agromyces sp. LHK192]
MVAGYSAAQVRAAEAPHLAAGVPLMRMAAAALAAALRRELRRVDAPEGPVLALVGAGDNGGDALYAASELAGEGVDVTVAATSTRMHPDAAAAARDAGARFLTAPPSGATAVGREFAVSAERAALVVDGILGTGSTSPALRGAARELVAALRPVLERTGAPVIAVDLPSGIHPDDGSVPDPTVLRAVRTVTFGAAKAGLLIEPGADYAGAIEVVDLGLGAELANVTPLVERA